MPHTITVLVGESEKKIEVRPDKSLHAIVTLLADTILEAPCGGAGKCGKCKLIVEEGGVSEVTDQERRLLSDAEIEHGVRLACLTYPLGDVRLRIREDSQAHILVTGVAYDAEVLPGLRKTHLRLRVPSLSDQRDDFVRLSDE